MEDSSSHRNIASTLSTKEAINNNNDAILSNRLILNCYPSRHIRLTETLLVPYIDETTADTVYGGCCTSMIAAGRKNVLRMCDIVGCSSKKSNGRLYVYVSSFSVEETKSGKIRVPKTDILTHDYPEKSEGNDLLKIWMKALVLLSNDFSVERSVEGILSAKVNQRNFLILINPKSGTNKSRKIFDTSVAPILNLTSTNYVLMETEYSNHAYDIGKTCNMHEFDTVMFCSGDGLIHEFCNGLMARPGGPPAVSLSVIPTGTGNGIACSLAFRNGFSTNLPDLINLSVFTALKRNHTLALDMVKLKQAGAPGYSVLNVLTGIPAECDSESEGFRFLGDLRLTLIGMKKVFFPPLYKMELSYLPVNSDEWVTISGRYPYMVFTLFSHLSRDFVAHPTVPIGQGFMKLVYVLQSETKMRRRLFSLMLKMEDGSYVYEKDVVSVDITAFRLKPKMKRPGVLTVDGEILKLNSIKGKLVSSNIRLLVGPS